MRVYQELATKLSKKLAGGKDANISSPIPGTPSINNNRYITTMRLGQERMIPGKKRFGGFKGMTLVESSILGTGKSGL